MDDTIWQIDVRALAKQHDARGSSLLAQARRAGFDEVTRIRSTRLYQIGGSLDRQSAEALAAGLFADPVIECWDCTDRLAWPQTASLMVEVHLQPGIMDPVAISALDASGNLLGGLAAAGACVAVVRTAWRYEIAGITSLSRLEELARQVLANPCVEAVFIRGLGRCDRLPERFPQPPSGGFERRTVTLTDLSDGELESLSRQRHLFLSAVEMGTVADHFAKLGRDPTDLELETIAQTWSEHCVHKTLKSAVVYRGRAFGNQDGAGSQDDADRDIEKAYDNLLADTIVRATRTLDKPWCLSVFEDNAGIAAFDDRYGIAFKVETHNHPSAIDPYGGAATGAGGCIRDILGCGLGAKPIANTDVFCLAKPDYATDRLPRGVLHPQRVLRGVVSGVRDYGNRMGIPTVAGGLHFDDRYLGNPLVFCGCLGLIPRDRIDKEPRVGDSIVVAGGRTGRDGLGGATFSSAELTDTHADEFAHAVQIGNAIEEKKVLDALLRARDHERGCLYSAITDCGAGGLSSAVGEMAETLGATVDLEHVPLKYSGLRYNEVWLSEAQERMVLSVGPENLQVLLAIFAEEDVETAVIGRFTGDAVLRVRYRDSIVGELDCRFLHHGLPKQRRTARWDGPKAQAPDTERESLDTSGDLSSMLLSHLQSLSVCSREPVFGQYDHEVQGASVIKPSVGIGQGPSDAAVIRPVLTEYRGIAIGCGLCPRMADDDPYWMAVMAIDEAVRNVVCVGADADRIAILDNFCWGGCEDEHEMGTLVRACQGCHDAAVAYGVPFISGKDSLNNQFSLSKDEAERLNLPPRINIPATLLISAMGMVDDVRKCVTSDLKHPGNRLVYVPADVRTIGLQECAAAHRAVSGLVRGGGVVACHDVSDGGLAVCLAEMCIGGARGAVVDVGVLGADRRAWALLFDESNTAYVLELDGSVDLAAVDGALELGRVSDDNILRIVREQETLIAQDVPRLGTAWRGGLASQFGEAAR